MAHGGVSPRVRWLLCSAGRSPLVVVGATWHTVPQFDLNVGTHAGGNDVVAGGFVAPAWNPHLHTETLGGAVFALSLSLSTKPGTSQIVDAISLTTTGATVVEVTHTGGVGLITSTPTPLNFSFHCVAVGTVDIGVSLVMASYDPVELMFTKVCGGTLPGRCCGGGGWVCVAIISPMVCSCRGGPILGSVFVCVTARGYLMLLGCRDALW